MINEIALEPDVLAKPENIRYFLEQFDVHKGRLIADFPQRWVSEVYRMWSRTLKDVERRRFENLLATIERKVIVRNVKRKCEGIDWLENAEAVQNTRDPFHAIVARENPRNREHVLVADMIEEDTPLWKTNRQNVIPRNARAISDIAAPLIHISKEILLVEPYFDPCNGTFKSSLRTVLYHLAHRRNRAARVELHCTIHKTSGNNFWDDCHENLPDLVPEGVRLDVFRWSKKQGGERFHRRYVLTERGGIAYEGGLDRGKEGETTDVYLLESAIHEKRWTEYQVDSEAFEMDKEGPIEIHGLRSFR